MNKLPKKLSDLIPIAKEDAIKALKSPIYKLNNVEDKLHALYHLRMMDLSWAIYRFYDTETMMRVNNDLEKLYENHKNLITLKGIILKKKKILDFFSQPMMVEFIDLLKKHDL